MKIIFGLFLFAFSFILIDCSSSSTSQKDGEYDTITLPSGLKYQDIRIGTGKIAEFGKKVTINYTWKTEDGTIVEDTYKSGQPFNFTIGAENILQGMNEGIVNMKEGGKRRLFIPSELGYGNRNVRNIPSNSNLIIDVELLKVQ